MCTISLCMIVKNEENSIRRCLSSTVDVVDEIIVVDTGSQDKTIDICKEYGAKIYQYPWQEDFSAARNFSIKKATSDWILWMDADEELFSLKRAVLIKMLKESSEALFVKMIHLLDGEPIEMAYISYHNRLFPNNKEYFFEGTIHERLNYKEDEMSDEERFHRCEISEKQYTCEAFSINHYGYRREQVSDKAIRNLKLLLKERELNTDNPWLDYHIGAELFRLQDVEKAFTFVNNAIGMFILQKKLPPALLYKLKYEILISTNHIENAMKGIEKAIEIYPDYVELHFYRGIILFRDRQYEESLKAFSYCLVLGDYNPKYLIVSGNGSFCAHYYLGRCYEEMGKIEHAVIAYEQCLCSNANYKPTLERLDILLDKRRFAIE